MFYSNPFPEVPSSPDVLFPPNFLSEHENDCVNDSDLFISGDCFGNTYRSLAPPSPVKDNITTIEQDFYIQQQQFSEGLGLQSSEDHDDLLESVISRFKKTKASSKDGHSKIYTARGPRDRRVRLSIDISRKFFSLQDMLGFDKALDWLLAKSKTAIKELVEETNHCFPSTPTYQSKLNFLESIMEGVDGHNGKKKSVLKYGDGKRKKTTQKAKEGFQGDTARGKSRAIARARARERAREKMQFRKLDDELKTLGHDEIDNQNLKTSTGEIHRVISTYPAAW